LLSSSIATNNNISLRCSVAPTHQRPKRIEKSRFGFDSIRFSLYSTRFDSTHFLKFLIRFDSIRLTLYSVRFDSIRLIHNEKSSFFVLCSTHCACLQKRFFLSPLRVGWVSVRQEFNTTNHTHTRPQEYLVWRPSIHWKRIVLQCTLYSAWFDDNVCDNFWVRWSSEWLDETCTKSQACFYDFRSVRRSIWPQIVLELQTQIYYTCC